jgi:hypothetical protein
MMSVPQFDPVIVRFLAEHEPFQPSATSTRWRAFRRRCCREPSPPASCIHWLPTSTTTPRADLLRTTRRILNLPVE